MRNNDIDIINRLCYTKFGKLPQSVSELPAAGSSRRYYRLSIDNKNDVIATIGTSVKENEAFIYLSEHYDSRGFNVPKILVTTDDKMAYLQTDLGELTLFDRLKTARESGVWGRDELRMLEDTVSQLAALQFDNADKIDYTKCYPIPEMDRKSIMWDLYYFKYCFLKAAVAEIDEVALEADFDKIASSILVDEIPMGFMYRDFQSRNVIIHDGMPFFIDFQGGRRGPCLYDIVSFLWQAKASYPVDVRRHLLSVYFFALKNKISVSEEVLRKHLPNFILFRTLQVLGAYGFRGYFERKAHFIQSIPAALNNLAELFAENDFNHLPYLKDIMQTIISTRPQVEQSRNCLRVKISSFSYRKGYPEDLSGNGGGYVFDCRAVTNPGKYEEYKQLTGLDTPVIEFIESTDEMKIFLDNAFALVSASVKKYLERGFKDLSVAFGCTGGRHRSVYAAQRMAERINSTLGVEVELCHRERKIKSFFPAR